MHLERLRRIGWLALAMMLALPGCAAPSGAQPSPTVAAPPSAVLTPSVPVSPSPTPGLSKQPTTVTPTPTPAPASGDVPTDALQVELAAIVATELPPATIPEASGKWTDNPDTGIGVLPLEDTARSGMFWVAHTYGRANHESGQQHFVAFWKHTNAGWQELSRLEIDSQQYIDAKSVRQVSVEPSRLWVEVQGIVGIHDSCYTLLSFDGKTPRIEVSHRHSSPEAGSVKDLDGDGQLEVILNLSDEYVFSYASGERFIDYKVLRWDGSGMAETTLRPLSDSAAAESRQLINRAVELAQAGLWKQAREMVEQAPAAAMEDPLATWDILLIRLHSEARAQQVSDGVYPLLDNIFYGDYSAALDIVRAYPPEQLFSQQNPLVNDTVARGWTRRLSTWVTTTTTAALEAEPDLAPAFFLRGWATYLIDPTDPQVLADIERAARLNTADPLYTQSVAYLKH